MLLRKYSFRVIFVFVHIFKSNARYLLHANLFYYSSIFHLRDFDIFVYIFCVSKNFVMNFTLLLLKYLKVSVIKICVE